MTITLYQDYVPATGDEVTGRVSITAVVALPVGAASLAPVTRTAQLEGGGFSVELASVGPYSIRENLTNGVSKGFSGTIVVPDVGELGYRVDGNYRLHDLIDEQGSYDPPVVSAAVAAKNAAEAAAATAQDLSTAQDEAIAALAADTGSETRAALNATYGRLWQASTAYSTAEIVRAPNGGLITRTAEGTSRPTYDSTEQALWTPVNAPASGIAKSALVAGVQTSLDKADNSLGKDRSWVNLWDMLPAGTAPASVTDWLPYYDAAVALLNPNGADPCGGTVFVPAMSTPYLVSDTVKVGNKVILRGAGRSTSMIKSTPGFNTSHPLVQLGNGSTSTQAFGTRIEDLYVNCDDRVLVGVYSNQVNEQGGVRNCSINKFTDIGVDFNATGATLQVPMGVVECEISPSNSASWRYGIRYTGFPDGPIRKVTINSGSATGTAAVYLDSCPNFTVQGLHAERCTDAIYATGSTCYGHIDGLTATTGVTGNGVRLSSTQQGRFYMNNLYAPNATNVVNDEATGNVIAASGVGGIVALYVVEKNASGAQTSAPIFTTAPGVTNRWRSDIILHGSRIIYQRSLQTAVSGSVAVNLVNGNFVELQFGGNITNLSIGQPVDGMRFTLRLKQDATGSRTVSWANTWHFENGTAPTLSTAANTSDFFEFICLGGHAYQVGKQITGVTA